VKEVFELLKSYAPEFRECIYDFNRLPDSAEVVRQLVAYDSRLFLLWNKMHERWELWRWRNTELPRDQRTIGGETDLYAAAKLQCYNVAPDMRLIQALPGADLWREIGTDDPDKVADHLDEGFDEGMKQRREEVKRDVQDLVEDNHRILRRDISDEFSGYYPSTVNPPAPTGKWKDPDDSG